MSIKCQRKCNCYGYVFSFSMSLLNMLLSLPSLTDSLQMTR